MRRVNVWYLYHSGFAVETEDSVLIFDYFKNECTGNPCLANGVINPEELKDKKHVYVFASHRHPDHFNPVVLSWKEILPQAEYFLSYDIPKQYHKNGINIISPNETYQTGNIVVRSFKSTDEGVAFLLDFNGLSIYHAGDLNWWHWFGEPDDWNKNMEHMYKKEISLIKDYPIDIAFLTADPRQEDAELWGITYFLENVDVKVAFPMHFWDDYSIMPRIKDAAKDNPVLYKVITIDSRGQHFSFPY
ncbi:MAG: MBL fold metallo-hydrolase [Clostridiaceae bacterium]|nr:MBL fold metallo-hydrolase [Clostridiaceae bacterium]